jgi:transposase
MDAKRTPSRRRGKPIRLLDEEVAFIGVDVHKKTYSVCVYTEERDIVTTWVQPSDPAALAARLGAVRAQVARVVYEAGPTGYGLARHLRAADFPVDVVAPSKTPAPRSRSGKGDRRDAKDLARLAAKDMLTPIYVPTAEQEADRQLARRREQLARQVRRVKHRIKSFLLQHGLPGFGGWTHEAIGRLRSVPLCPQLRFCLDSQLADLEHAQAQLQAAEREVARLARSERHAPVVEALRRVPGVGVVTAMAIRTELLEPERFTGPAQVASFTGLAPCVRRSGEQIRSGPILKTGSRSLRRLLVEAAWRWKSRDPAAGRLFSRLLRATASSKKAIVGVARHLVILLWRILTGRIDYRLGRAPEEARPPDRGPAAVAAS